jgi:uncharacterized protein YeeX (DUF496 family)
MLKSIFEKRYLQLQQQASIDNILINLKSDCSDIVSDYLLLQRNITRNQQLKIIDTNFWNLYKEMDKQVDINQKITNQFLTDNMTCERLMTIIHKNKETFT